jgi:hypothetical protein
MNSIQIPDPEEFRRGLEAFERNERRGCVYYEALNHVSEFWGNSNSMVEGISWLIRSWNRFYANFNFDDLINCIDINLPVIDELRNRSIDSLSSGDDKKIRQLFNQFLDALKRKTDNLKSAVSVAKAFGILAPDFLPIWDSTIAWRYGCLYGIVEVAAPKYVTFCWKMKEMSEKVRNYDCVRNSKPNRSLLKMIDEYNYSKFTGGWI